MNFPFFIAKRYNFSSNKKNIVNIISYISSLGVAIGTAALVIVLSVFNGFEQIVLDMYNSFDPHIKVSSSQGKTFIINDIEQKILDIEEIENFSFTLTERVLMEHNNNELIVELKGVDDSFDEIVKIDSLLKLGDYFYDSLYKKSDVLVLGAGVKYNLSVDLNNIFSKIVVTVPDKKSKYIRDSSDIEKGVFTPIGMFSIQSEYDSKYSISPINRVQKLLDRDGEASSLEILLKNEKEMDEFKIKLQQILGEGFIIKTRIEQHQFLYKLLNSEKLAVFIILTFILIIASFNIISSLSMLMIEKKNDISTFWKLGTPIKQIRGVFFIKGFLGVLIGSLIGIFLGVLFSLLQQYFGFISMEGNFVVNSYPIKLDLIDVIIVELIVIIIGLIASYYPSKVLTDRFIRS
tara:strand:+ start:7905 stop:9119 length:1215 start_codon:yes stop_codon:yes gene_type:complete